MTQPELLLIATSTSLANSLQQIINTVLWELTNCEKAVYF